MTRFEHFLRLCDLDGIVSAKTLQREAGGTAHRNAEWLRKQAARDRIVRVAEGRYGRAPEGTVVKPIDAKQLERQRRAQAKLRERRKVDGVCHDCGKDSAGMWRCAGCREKRSEMRARKLEAVCQQT